MGLLCRKSTTFRTKGSYEHGNSLRPQSTRTLWRYTPGTTGLRELPSQAVPSLLLPEALTWLTLSSSRHLLKCHLPTATPFLTILLQTENPHLPQHLLFQFLSYFCPKYQFPLDASLCNYEKDTCLSALPLLHVNYTM